MVENLDYLKFVFLINLEYKIIIEENILKSEECGIFKVFENCVFEFLKSIDVKEEKYV